MYMLNSIEQAVTVQLCREHGLEPLEIIATPDGLSEAYRPTPEILEAVAHGDDKGMG